MVYGLNGGAFLDDAKTGLAETGETYVLAIPVREGYGMKQPHRTWTRRCTTSSS